MAGIIVAGGSGFIGQEVIRAALTQNDPCLVGGHTVVNIDIAPPRPPDTRLRSWHDPNLDPRVRFIRADLADPQEAAKALDAATEWAGDVVALCNLVGLVRFGLRDERLYRPNVRAVENLTLECAERGLLFVQFSGTAVHGSAPRGKVRETQPLAPVESYGRSKARAEELVFDRVRRRGLRALIFRATNPIGPPLQVSELNKLYESVMKDPIIPAVRGSIANYVSTPDVGRAIIFGVEHADLVVPQAPETLSDIVYNLGVPESASDAQVARILIASIQPTRRKPVVQLDIRLVQLAALLATGANGAANLLRRTKKAPILHYQLTKLFRGSHDHDQTKFTTVFERAGFAFQHPTTADVLDFGAAYKFLTDWVDKRRSARIEPAIAALQAERTAS